MPWMPKSANVPPSPQMLYTAPQRTSVTSDYTLGPWAPGYSQYKFLTSSARFPFFVGSVGSGKTCALAEMAVQCALSNPGCEGFVGAPTFPMARKITFPTLHRALDFTLGRNNVEWFEGNNPYAIAHFYSSSGHPQSSHIWMGTVSSADDLRGPNLSWFGVDEITYAPWESFVQLQERLRDKRARLLRGFAVGTPKGYDAVYDFCMGDSARKAPPGSRELIRPVPYENAHNMDPEYYLELARSMDIRRFKQEVLGQFLPVFANQVYWAFSRHEFPNGNVGVRDIDPNLPLYWVHDFNVDPMSSLVIQVQPERPNYHPSLPPLPMEIRVLDELVLSTSSIPDAVKEFDGRYGNWLKKHGKGVKPVSSGLATGLQPYELFGAAYAGLVNSIGHVPSADQFVLYGDATKGTSHQTAESDWVCLVDTLNAHGLYPAKNVPESNPLVRDRVNCVNAMLCNSLGARTIIINPKCHELITDFERVAWKVGSSGMLIDESDRKRTHCSSACGYLITRDWPLMAKVGYSGEGRLV